MKGNILIVGGYGSVGRVISTTLGDRFPDKWLLQAGTIKRLKTCLPFHRGRLLQRSGRITARGPGATGA